ncbi:MAG: divergent polysaccharide deacetylase family protein [Hyphomicrobiaceae bacterium]|nr:divergent polysaccharide deacetylase family protein [Hyphomicrobiaceae bacterium]
MTDLADDGLEEALSRPLVKRRRLSLAPLMPWFVRIGGGLVAAVLLLAFGWILAVNDPLGGEPRYRVALDLQRAPATDATPVETQVVTPPVGGETGPATEPSGSSTVAGARVIQPPPATVRRGVAQFGPGGSLPSGADPNLVEKVGESFIPVVSGSGIRALDAYARPTDLSGVAGRLPRIAMVVTGLGISQTATQEALRRLPRDMTLAFAPYGGSLDRWSQRARQEGFEYLLQVPMEPFDYPDSDPGPHTLLTSLDETANMNRLYWAMSRLPTYVGMMNYMGARFTSSREAFQPVMSEIVTRGLIYLDDGSSARSEVRELAGPTDPVLRGDITIDVAAERSAIETRLLQLESIARERGSAIGIASALPVTLQTLEEWARDLRARGFILVPISAMARQGGT